MNIDKPLATPPVEEIHLPADIEVPSEDSMEQGEGQEDSAPPEFAANLAGGMLTDNEMEKRGPAVCFIPSSLRQW